MSYFFLLSYFCLFDFYMKHTLGIVNDERITFIKEKATMIWVPVQREPDIDFFKNLCYFWKRSRYYKWRAYHLYQRRSHYYLYWVPVQREQDIDFLKNLCHFWKRSRYCKRRAYPYIKEKVTTIYIEYLPKEKDTYLSHYGPLHVKVNKKK